MTLLQVVLVSSSCASCSALDRRPRRPPVPWHAHRDASGDDALAAVRLTRRASWPRARSASRTSGSGPARGGPAKPVRPALSRADRRSRQSASCARRSSVVPARVVRTLRQGHRRNRLGRARAGAPDPDRRTVDGTTFLPRRWPRSWRRTGASAGDATPPTLCASAFRAFDDPAAI